MTKMGPKTPEGRSMAKRHLREQIAVDRSHAKDHAKAVKKNVKRLAKIAKKGTY